MDVSRIAKMISKKGNGNEPEFERCHAIVIGGKTSLRLVEASEQSSNPRETRPHEANSAQLSRSGEGADADL